MKKLGRSQTFVISALLIIAMVITIFSPMAQEGKKRKDMTRGLKAAIYFVDDLAKAKDWYSKALEIKPYFDKSYYVGFDIDGFELGLEPGKVSRGNNLIAYWGVEDVEKELERLVNLGAKENRGLQVVNQDVKIASVIDPFGNILGIVENHHIPQKKT